MGGVEVTFFIQLTNYTATSTGRPTYFPNPFQDHQLYVIMTICSILGIPCSKNSSHWILSKQKGSNRLLQKALEHHRSYSRGKDGRRREVHPVDQQTCLIRQCWNLISPLWSLPPIKFYSARQSNTRREWCNTSSMQIPFSSHEYAFILGFLRE